LLRDLLDDVRVGSHEVVAAHPRLARDSGGDDDQLGSVGRSVVIGADDAGVEPLDGRGLVLIESLALGDALDDVYEDDGTGELFFGEALCGGGTDIPGANDRDFVEHGAGEVNGYVLGAQHAAPLTRNRHFPASPSTRLHF